MHAANADFVAERQRLEIPPGNSGDAILNRYSGVLELCNPALDPSD